MLISDELAMRLANDAAGKHVERFAGEDVSEELVGAMARHFAGEEGRDEDEERADRAFAAVVEELTEDAYDALRSRFDDAVESRRVEMLKDEFRRMIS